MFLGISSAEDAWDGTEDPEDWPKTFPECGGKKQSPITILQAKSEDWTPTDRKNKKFEMKFDGYDKEASVEAYNTGYLANITFKNSSSEKPRITLTQNGETVEYYLTNIDFHWESEHGFYGRRSDFETQMWHRNLDKNRVIALAYLINECSDSEEEEELNMYQELVVAQDIVEYGNSYSYTEVPKTFMPRNYQCGYFMYEGSFTTPPCTEGVTWFVYRKTLCLSEIVINAFKTMQNKNGKRIESNNRPFQENDPELVYLSCNEDPEDDEDDDDER
ncbi:hypothetical protein R5R35_014225 [Gryllus longicercus]